MSSSLRFPGRGIAWAGLAIVFAAGLAFYNSFWGAFVFDDIPVIGGIASPHRSASFGGLPTEGRPLLALSLNLNYAISGVEPWSYHLVNVAIHTAGALLLFGIVRRTLARCPREIVHGGEANANANANPNPAAALWLALAIALLWVVHPLQTESVTYIVQRAESLSGCLYLLTLYGFIRGLEGPAKNTNTWMSLSWFGCLLGMATKETSVTAPLIVLLFDRIFVTGSFHATWERRAKYYSALAATWLLVMFLVVRAGANRGGTAGFGAGIAWWQYALTQSQAIVHYIHLALWPHPLIFDYGAAVAHDPWSVLPQLLLLIGLLVAAVVAVRRGTPAGFAGAFFLATLAPSSSVVPIATQTMAEHRMYLPLVPAIGLAVASSIRIVGRKALLAWLGVVVALTLITHARNRDYRSAEQLYRHDVAWFPDNPRSHYNLGHVLAHDSREREAIACFEAALRRRPDYADAHDALGHALFSLGRQPEAIAHYEAALRADPKHLEAQCDLGNALLQAGDISAALVHFEQAARIDPNFLEARVARAGALVLLGRSAEAVAVAESVLRLDAGHPGAHFALGNALTRQGKTAMALSHFEAALVRQPRDARLHFNYANALSDAAQDAAAIAHYEQAILLNPNHAAARYNFGNLLARAHRLDEAAAQYRETIRLRPDDAAAHHNLGSALFELGRLAEAAEEYAATLRLDPDFPEARANLERVRARLGLPSR